MIMYTPVPPEVLWYEEDREKAQFVEGTVQDIPVQMRLYQGTNIVERVLSTDPLHFLNSACQPGSKII